MSGRYRQGAPKTGTAINSDLSEGRVMSSSKLDDATATAFIDAAPVTPVELPHFEPYESPAGGWGALQATAKALREQSIILKGSRSLLSMNQPDGFDCPGCA